MPSSRQFKVIGLVALITFLTLYYVANGARLTHESEFYKKTVAAIEHRKNAEAQAHKMEEERQIQDRVERLKKEHDAAMASATTNIVAVPTKHADDRPESQQKPIVDQKKGAKGRKKMQDGKIVGERPATDNNDGVAKVGNIASKSSGTSNGDEHAETAEEHQIEVELNNILKRGPIIIFSKSYCPYSKKAKRILLDNYTISPPPYVVELDQHDLGPALQDALLASTGRRTVPNILINGKSIGGGDDVEALHNEGKLIETVKTMGGKRIMSVDLKPAEQTEVRFKA